MEHGRHYIRINNNNLIHKWHLIKFSQVELHAGKPEGKRPLRRPKHRWLDDIKMDLREIGWDGVD
jgi:hypothetical protein